MTRYVAFLGSINVGGNRVAMADLREALVEEGFGSVSTIGASGNVVFDHADAPDSTLERRIAQALAKHFSIESFAVVRSRDELVHALAESPFAAAGEEKLVHVYFLSGQPDQRAFETLFADFEGKGNERMAPGRRALHVAYDTGVANSKLTNRFVERRLECRATARNIRSIRRVLDKMDP